jgi:hypothetical protein
MLAADIAQYLDDENLVTVDPSGVAGNCFIDTLPATPETAVGIFSGSAGPPDAKTSLDRPGVQLQVRGDTDPRTAFALAEALRVKLHGLSNLTLASGTLVKLITANQSQPVYIGTDENGRHQYSVNLSCITRS